MIIILMVLIYFNIPLLLHQLKIFGNLILKLERMTGNQIITSHLWYRHYILSVIIIPHLINKLNL